MPRIFDVVEYADAPADEIVHRVPETGSGDFRLGSQVIVRESQVAIFFRDGRALDVFQPGRHTITTANIPLLVNFLGVLFSGQTPFKAEVYFVNMRDILDLKWGTPQPIALRDSELGLVQLRAFGTYSMQVADPQLFVNKIVGVQGLYTTNDIVSFLRGIVISRFTDVLAEGGKSIFDLPRMFDELSVTTRVKLRDDFSALGLQLKTLYITSISPTEETQKAIDERASMGAIGNMQAYMQFKAARALGDAAKAGGEGAGGATQTGLGLGAGVGLGSLLAQIMGQSMQHPTQQPQASQPTPMPAAEPSVDQVFQAMQMLVNQQLSLPQADRDNLLAKLQGLNQELNSATSDLGKIKSMRKDIVDSYPWVGPKLDEVFATNAVSKALSAAATRFMGS
ncbi:MAG: SPFH domain-containing protein [Chloroflexi bacterium]|nr:SPFH domain-containing protein [Chloroflexota bacterium]